MHGWLKEAAPSDALRRWFGHDPEKWLAFKRYYFEELAKEPEAVREIVKYAKQGNVTLLFSSHDTVYNNAAALKEYLDKLMPGIRKNKLIRHVTAAP